MIQEFEAAEFIAMVALNELKEGRNDYRVSIYELSRLARKYEADAEIRVNLSTSSMQSFFARAHGIVSLQRDEIIISNIEDGYGFFRIYASKDTLSNL